MTQSAFDILEDLSLDEATRIIDLCREQQALEERLAVAPLDDHWAIRLRMQEIDQELEEAWGSEIQD